MPSFREAVLAAKAQQVEFDREPVAGVDSSPEREVSAAGDGSGSDCGGDAQTGAGRSSCEEDELDSHNSLPENRRSLIRRISGPKPPEYEISDVLRDEPYPSTRYWTTSHRQTILPILMDGRRIVRGMWWHEDCFGIGGGLCSLLQVGVPLDRFTASELSPIARSFAMRNFGTSIHHLWSSMRNASEGVGDCDVHGHHRHPVPRYRPDILSASTPCHPFSTNREGRFSHSPPDQHAERGAMFGPASEALGSLRHNILVFRPYGVFIEQVEGMDRLGDSEQQTCLQLFFEIIQSEVEDPDALGSPLFPSDSCMVLSSNPLPWIKCKRPRPHCMLML